MNAFEESRDETTITPSFSAWQRRELGGEAVDRTAVADALLPFHFADHEAQAETALAAGFRKLRAKHLGDRLGLEELLAVERSIGEQARLELRQIEDGGIHAPGGWRAEFEGRRRELAAVIGPHDGVGEPLLHLRGWSERAGFHSERIEDPALKARLELLASLTSEAPGRPGRWRRSSTWSARRAGRRARCRSGWRCSSPASARTGRSNCRRGIPG